MAMTEVRRRTTNLYDMIGTVLPFDFLHLIRGGISLFLLLLFLDDLALFVGSVSSPALCGMFDGLSSRTLGTYRLQS